MSSNKVIERKLENGVKKSHKNPNRSISFKRMDMSMYRFWMVPIPRYKIKSHILFDERLDQWFRFYYEIYNFLAILL